MTDDHKYPHDFWPDKLVRIIAYPNLYFVLFVVNVISGLLVGFNNVGTPVVWESEYGITRFWFVVWAWIAAYVLIRYRNAKSFLVGVSPIFLYAIGTIESARQVGIWLTVLFYFFLCYVLVVLYVQLVDQENGRTH